MLMKVQKQDKIADCAQKWSASQIINSFAIQQQLPGPIRKIHYIEISDKQHRQGFKYDYEQ